MKPSASTSSKPRHSDAYSALLLVLRSPRSRYAAHRMLQPPVPSWIITAPKPVASGLPRELPVKLEAPFPLFVRHVRTLAFELSILEAILKKRVDHSCVVVSPVQRKLSQCLHVSFGCADECSCFFKDGAWQPSNTSKQRYRQICLIFVAQMTFQACRKAAQWLGGSSGHFVGVLFACQMVSVVGAVRRQRGGSRPGQRA